MPGTGLLVIRVSRRIPTSVAVDSRARWSTGSRRYAFDERGARTLVMVADPDYLAIRVYRSVGFDDTEVQTQLIQQARV